MKYFIILISFFSCSAIAQVVPIPYRVGNRFGVMNIANSQMPVQPQFDWMEVSDADQQIFTAYRVQDTTVLSALIYRGEVLLNNQRASSYYLKNRLFQAIEYRQKTTMSPRTDDHFEESQYLYTIDGMKILSVPVQFANILSVLDEKDQLDETLVLICNKDGRYSLFLYNKPLKKISRYLFQNVSQLQVY